MSDEETRPEDNSDGQDKDSFSKFIHDNLSMDGMPDAPLNDAKKAKDDDEPKQPPVNPFTSRFGRSTPTGFSRFGSSKSDDDDDDDFGDDDDTDSPFSGSTGIFGGKLPFSGDNKDRPSPFGNSGSRFGGGSGSGSFGDSGSRFGGGNRDSGNNTPFGSRFGGDKNTPPPPPSPFSPLGRLSNNKQSPQPLFGRGLTALKTKQQKRVEVIRRGMQVFKELLPSLLLLLIFVYFITIFSQYQPDVLKNEMNQLQQTITQQESQIRQLQAQIEAMSRER